jgi:tetratricopeptide (TPR) repeat protein
VDRDLETVCLKCLHKEPGRRYGSAEELAQDLERWLAGEPVRARRVSLWEQGWKSVRHRPALAALVGVSAAALAGVFLLLLWHNQQLQSAADREHQLAEDAQAQRDAAREGRRFARRAADEMYTQVAEQWLGQQPQLTEVQRDFLQKALRFYQEFAREEGTDPSLRLDKARAYDRVAHIQYDLGHEGEAERPAREALALLERLAADFPDVPDYRREVASGDHNLGLVLAATGRLGEAEQAYRQALLLQGRLADEFPTVPRYRHDLANSCNSLGNLLKAGRFNEGEKALRQAVALRKELAAASPTVVGYRQELADASNNLATLLMSARRPQEAEQVLREAVSVEEKLAALPLPDYPQRPVAQSHIALGNLVRESDRKAAAEHYRRAMDILTQLVKIYPVVPDYQRDLAGCENSLGQMLLKSGERAAAEEHCRRALDLRARLVRDFPTVPDHRHYLAASHIDLGNARLQAGDRQGAAEHYRQAFERYTGLVKEFPAVPAYPQGLHNTLWNLSHLLREQGELAEARRVDEQAIGLLGTALGASPQNRDCRRTLRECYSSLAETLLLLHEHAEASRAAVQLPRLTPEEWQQYLAATRILSRCVPLAEEDAHLSADQRRVAVEAYERQARAFLPQALERGRSDPEAENDLAWFLATGPDPRLRAPGQAVELAKKLVEQVPQQAACWNTLGVAHYYAGNWQAAVAALDRSVRLPGGKNAYNCFFLAMAHHRLGAREEVRMWYDRGVQGMDKTRPKDERLGHFRAEAAALLGINEQPAPQGKEAAPRKD